MTSADVIVVGAGLSGLAAAWEIQKRDPNVHVIVLEAKDRVGGRTLTLPMKTATGEEDGWDLGAQWVSSAHKNILEVMSELNLETYTQYTTGKKLIHLTDDTIKTYSGPIPNLSLPVLLDMGRTIHKINKLSKSVSFEDGIIPPAAEYYDSMTVETLTNQSVWTDTAMRFIRMALGTLTGANSSQVSAFYFLRMILQGGGLEKLIETSKGCGQELKVKGGTQQISQLLAKKIGIEKVHLSKPVTAVQMVGDRMEVVTESGNVFTAQRVIIAIPVHLNANIKFTPPLPSTKQYLFNNMPMGNLVKVIAVYEKTFWREKGFSGEILNEGKLQEQFVDPIDVVFDATSCNGHPALVAFMSANRGIVWADIEAKERKQAVLKCLAKFFGDEALAPVSYEEKNWHLEPYTGGCPVSLCGPGMLHFYSTLGVPDGRIHWAGTETASEYVGYMEGAVSSGKRAALEVLSNIRPDLLTPEEKSAAQVRTLSRRKSQLFRQRHKVFRYAIGLGLLAVAIVVLKKMYFRIAI